MRGEEEGGPVDRRRRLRLALIGLLALALFPLPGAPAVASPRESGHIQASEVAQYLPARQAGTLVLQSGEARAASDAGSTGGETLLYTSPVVDAGQLFDRVGVHWVAAPGSEGSLFVELRISADGSAWTDWTLLHPDEDLADLERNEWYAAPQAVAGARFAQYRVWLTDGDPDALVRVGLTFMDVSDLNQGPLARFLNDLRGAWNDLGGSYVQAAPVGASRLLTRQDWAADETLMSWTPKYQRVQKAVIHHTVTDDGGANVAATIRGIYYYHAVTRGWGDIGYNYLVDKFGNIWTGRQGGDNTIGGHAYGWNNGTIGVAAIGDYSVMAPTGALQNAIANLVSMKFRQLGIQPFGNETFTHQEQASDGSWVNVTSNPPNIQGHRDCNYIQSQYGGQTACPGSGLYNILSGIRSITQAASSGGYAVLPYLDPALPKAAFPGTVLQVPVNVVNQGATVIAPGTVVSYRVLQKGVVAVGEGGKGTLASPIAPGASATVTVPFTAPAFGSYLVRWDLQTAGQWWNTLYSSPVREQWFRSADWSVDWIKDTVPISWVAGETKSVSVTIQNDGGRVWPATGANPVQLGYKWVSNSTNNTFPGAQRTNLPADVPPGGTVTLQIQMTAPAYPTNYTNYLDLYKVGEFAFADKGVAPDDTPTGVSVDFHATYAPQAVPFLAGQTATAPLTITNTGKGTFPVASSYPVNLAYHWVGPQGAAAVWDGARTKLPADLPSGGSVQLGAKVTAPPAPGPYTLQFDLVQEGVTWFSQRGVVTGNLSLAVGGTPPPPPNPTYGATYQIGAAALALTGAQTTVPITVTNASNFWWPAAGANPIDLSYHWVDADGNTAVWDGARTRLPNDAAPGTALTLQAALVFPTAPGSYTLSWDLVHEGIAWFSQKGVATANLAVTVSAPTSPPRAVAPPATGTYGASYDASRTPPAMPTEIRTAVAVTLANASSFAWGPGVNLSYHWYDVAGNAVVWDGWRTPLAIAPGDSATVTAQVAGPPRAGAFTLRFDVVQEGVAWFSQRGVASPSVSVVAGVPAYGAVFTAAPAAFSVTPGGAVLVPLTIKNTGSLTWKVTDLFDVSYHVTNWDDSVVAWDGLRTALPSDVAPGQSVTLNVGVRGTAAAGSYVYKFEVVREGLTWFSGQNVPTGNVAANVR